LFNGIYKTLLILGPFARSHRRTTF